MIEVLWHGRGGQGAFTAARLLGAAASMGQGRYALAFPAFGPERRGAPMKAYTKIADAVIGDRSAIKQADYVVYLDDTLLGAGWDAELKPGGIVLVNSRESFDDKRIVALDAEGISTAVLGRPIPNTVFLGALSVLCDQVEAEDVKEAIRQYMPEKLHAKNIAIVDNVRGLLSVAGGRSDLDAGGACGSPATSQECDAVIRAGSEDGNMALGGEDRPARPNASIPVLRDDALDSDSFAHSTCFEAGHLVAKNAGWRNVRPVIDQTACTGCLQCYLYCPDGTVFKVEAAADDKRSSLVAIDYDFCKGCGICATLCAVGAIGMVSEKEALRVETTVVEETVSAQARSCDGGAGMFIEAASDEARAAVPAGDFESEVDAR